MLGQQLFGRLGDGKANQEPSPRSLYSITLHQAHTHQLEQAILDALGRDVQHFAEHMAVELAGLSVMAGTGTIRTTFFFYYFQHGDQIVIDLLHGNASFML
jgi:hypothetical protein